MSPPETLPPSTKTNSTEDTESVESPAERSLRLADYRKGLVSSEQKSQEDFDKTVLSLSGGALGISFVFLKDVIGPNPVNSPDLLFASWVCWGLSTFCVLASYYFSHLALRKAIKQVDEDTVYQEAVGGHFRGITAVLNALGAILFLLGVCTITFFASANLKSKGVLNDGPQKTTTSIPAAAASATAAPARPSGNRN